MAPALASSTALSSNVVPLPAPDIDVTVTFANDNYDEGTDSLQIPLPDGDVEVSFGPSDVDRKEERKDVKFNANLAEYLTEADLSSTAEKLLLGIQADDQSRHEWLENFSQGLSLLGLQIRTPKGAATGGATATEGTSTVDHPLLLEAILRFQANARGELLPSDGPVKVRNDGDGSDLNDMLANALEKDMNHYLTKTATEYYPDTDRMLLLLGYSGIGFKKGFHDPIKRRPVIQSISAEDLIVSNASCNLEGSGRITHRIMMKPSLMKRMQLIGAYRDIVLPTVLGGSGQKDAVKEKIAQIQGIAPPTYIEPADMDRELYECYCEIELPGFEHVLDGKETGVPLPYKVTIDKEARRILEIRRNWEEDDPFCMPRNRIIAYIFIPGLGFYGIGLLNVLGNATKAVTAAWRLMLDAGMFANFPGFLYLKSLAKQLTNQFRVPPGGGLAIDPGGIQDIRAAVMPLPYKDPSAVFIQLIENIATTAQRVGGTAETQIGEGKADVPVGTILAQIEQATKLMSAVHKRLHTAQGQEFDMLKSLLMEDPEALWRHNRKSKVLKMLTEMAGQGLVVQQMESQEDHHRAMFLAALSNCELVPAADPNTSSQTERYLKVVAARQMATGPTANPNIDLNKVDEKAFRTMGWDPTDFFKPPPPPGTQPPPNPEEIMAQATMTAAQAKIAEAQTRAKEADVKATFGMQELEAKKQIASLQVSKEVVIHHADRQHEAEQAQADRDHQHAMAATQRHHDFHQGLVDHHSKLALAGIAAQNAHRVAAERNMQAAHGGLVEAHRDTIMGLLDHRHEGLMQHHDHLWQARHDHLARQHEAEEAERQRKHEARMKPKEKASDK